MSGLDLAPAAQWLAPIATIIAAGMTAANLGARITGWGFVFFLAGSLAWCAVAIATGQNNLLATNAFLTLVNIVGIWRWLGRQRVYEDGAAHATEQSEHQPGPDIISARNLSGLRVLDSRNEEIGTVVDALFDCENARISYVVVASGGIGGIAERLRAVRAADVLIRPEHISLRITRPAFEALPLLSGDQWPAPAPDHRLPDGTPQLKPA